MFFAGFAVGRLGHIYWGDKIDAFDHWIYGVMLFVPGMVYENRFMFFVFAFGFGLIISDLKDFVNLKWRGPDQVEVKKFWHID